MSTVALEEHQLSTGRPELALENIIQGIGDAVATIVGGRPAANI